MDLRDLLHNVRKVQSPTVVATHQKEGGGASLIDVIAGEMMMLRESQDRLSRIVPILVQSCGLSPDSPMGRSAVTLSQEAEKDIQHNQYHNRYHVQEVVVAAFMLGRREKIPLISLAELILAATAHDLNHQGRHNQHPFELEHLAAETACAILEREGVSEEISSKIEQMILCTDFYHGTPHAREIYVKSQSLPQQSPERILAAQCLLLTEADIMFSCFDLDYNDLLSRLLCSEMHLDEETLPIADRIRFLESTRFLSKAALQFGLEERRMHLLRTLQQRMLGPS